MDDRARATGAPPGGDPYQLLGIAPDADARGIKIAYFALVRRFPPETHPEAFRRIRAAYELLSDPAQRAFHDAARETGAASPDAAELAALREGYLEARERGDLSAARRSLERILTLAPGRAAARHALGLLLLELREWAEAEAQLRFLVEAEPGSAALRCDLARALAGQARLPESLAEAQRAAELAGEDHAAHARAADVLVLLGRRAAAREELLAALRLEGGSLPVPPLVLRLARTYVLDADYPAALKVLLEAVDAWAKSADARRQDGLSALAGGAASLFDAGQTREANRLLAACAAAAPGCCGGPVPEPVEVRREELPPAMRAWIEAQRKTPALMAQYHRPSTPYLKRMVACELFLAAMFLGGTYDRHCGTMAAWFGKSTLCLALLLGFVIATARPWLRARLGPFGHGLILHPLHLLAVSQDRVRIIPLLQVTSIEASGQGATTRLRIFGEYGPQATGFASNHRAGQVTRRIEEELGKVLGALAAGTLHTHPAGADFPAALFQRRGLRAELADLRPLRLLGYAALALAVSAALNGVLYPLLCG